ncbi:MAG: rRNA maturation RNase YbeY [Gammaproteobacteria bacterium]|nr:rRNA maturation RNase YbeY [Gammaproteobacteria bacterium]
MAVDIELSISEGVEEAALPSEEKLQHWAQSSYLGNEEVIASLQIVGSDEMQDLNKNYRGKDKPTNVLSFPMELPDEVDINILGDLALCDEVIESEAKQQGKSLEAHWAHMVVHGMLHLQGYDHIEDNEAETMEAKEIEIMKELGFENPYQ